MRLAEGEQPDQGDPMPEPAATGSTQHGTQQQWWAPGDSQQQWHPEVYAWQAAHPPQQRRPPVATLQDLFGAVSVGSLIALLGVPVGWLWSRLAPAQLSVVQDDRELVPLPTESQHRFDDLATFMLLGAVVGLLTGIVVWMLRRRRGPLVLVGLVAGSLFAAWLATRTGLSFADGRFGDAVAQAAPGDVVAGTPRLESTWAIIVQPLLAAIAYGTAAATNAQQDLGRHR